MADLEEKDLTEVSECTLIRVLDAEGHSRIISFSNIIKQSKLETIITLAPHEEVSVLLDNQIYSITDTNYGASALIDISWDAKNMKIIYQTANDLYSIKGVSYYSFYKKENGRTLEIVNNSPLVVSLIFHA